MKENIKAPRHWPLCGEFTGTGEFPAQRASNAENVSIWWRHHDKPVFVFQMKDFNYLRHLSVDTKASASMVLTMHDGQVLISLDVGFQLNMDHLTVQNIQVYIYAS